MKNKKKSISRIKYRVRIILLLLLQSNFIFAQKDSTTLNSFSAGIGYLLNANSFKSQYYDKNISGIGIWISYARETSKKYLLEGYIEYGNTYQNNYLHNKIGNDIGTYIDYAHYYFQFGLGRKFNLVQNKFFLKLSTGFSYVGNREGFVSLTGSQTIIDKKKFYNQARYILNRYDEIGGYFGTDFLMKLASHKYCGLRIEAVSGMYTGLYSILISPYLSLDF